MPAAAAGQGAEAAMAAWPGRRALLAGAAGAALTCGRGGPAQAEPIIRYLTVTIPAGPGGGWDGLGRAIELVARPAGLVGSFNFENVPGAGGVIGLARFVGQRRGRPNALLVGGAIMVGAALATGTPLSLADVVPVARLTEEAGVVAVPAQSPFQTLGDLLAALRADPAAVPVAGGSAGGIDHITLGLILRALGAQPRAAAYVAFAGGGPALAAILGGQVKAAISGLSEFSEQIRAGRMRALATTGAARTDPAVPTLRELGVNVVATNWRGVFAAPGVRAEARERLVALVTAVAQRPEWAALLRQRDWQDAFLAGPGFAEFLARDQAQTAAVLRDIGLAG